MSVVATAATMPLPPSATSVRVMVKVWSLGKPPASVAVTVTVWVGVVSKSSVAPDATTRLLVAASTVKLGLLLTPLVSVLTAKVRVSPASTSSAVSAPTTTFAAEFSATVRLLRRTLNGASFWLPIVTVKFCVADAPSGSVPVTTMVTLAPAGFSRSNSWSALSLRVVPSTTRSCAQNTGVVAML